MRETLPDTIKQDGILADQQELRGKPTWSANSAGLSLHVWRGPFYISPDAIRCEKEFQCRAIHFVVKDQNDLIASGLFEEWRFKALEKYGLPDLESFLMAADVNSRSSMEMAEALGAAWPDHLCDETPFHYGNVAHFERLRIEAASAAQSAAVWALIHRLVEREFRARKRASIIVLKAFPLEYEGTTTDANRAAFEHRQRAMMRHYLHRLNARPLGRKLGKDGWMWVEINCPLRPKK
jgi:hypothetical protein